MRIFALLAGMLVAGDILIALYWATSFSLGAWYTGVTLLIFALVGWVIALREISGTNE